jgi:hypothetical protein
LHHRRWRRLRGATRDGNACAGDHADHDGAGASADKKVAPRRERANAFGVAIAATIG